MYENTALIYYVLEVEGMVKMYQNVALAYYVLAAAGATISLLILWYRWQKRKSAPPLDEGLKVVKIRKHKTTETKEVYEKEFIIIPSERKRTPATVVQNLASVLDKNKGIN